MAPSCVFMYLLVTLPFSRQAMPILRSCEPIRVELCWGLGYNVTGMPNLVGHELQDDAEFTLQTFNPLIQYGCSAQLQFFLCSVYIPMCTEKVASPIGPCRRLCESVRARCYPVLQGFGFPWPAALNCSKFPQENNHEHMCMEGPGEVGGHMGIASTGASSPSRSSATASGKEACARFARPGRFVYVERSGRCAPLCEADLLFEKADKDSAEVWISVLASLCFISSLVAVLTYLADSGTGGSERFRYPERPLAFLALCYNLESVGWGVRAAAGRPAVACSPDPQSPARLLLSQDGLHNANCAVVFLLLYYFGMAAAVWWMLLTVSWFLSAALKWTHERIQQHSSLLHLAGWGLPAVQTIAVLVLRNVDADELFGVCYVGNQSTKTLMVFVLAPQFLYLVFGASLLLLGFLALYRQERTTAPMPLPSAGRQEKLETAVVRLGILAVFYIVPATCVLSSLLYEYWSRDDWLLAAYPRYQATQPKPSVWIFLLKLLMSLIVGITAIIWVWSSESISAWRRLCNRFGQYKQSAVESYQVQYYTAHAPGHAVLQQHQRHSSHRKYKKHGGETTV